MAPEGRILDRPPLPPTGAARPVSAAMRESLQPAIDIDLGDNLTFRIGTPKNELTNAPKGGGRFPCEAVLLGKTSAKFHIDVGVGDAVVGTPDRLTGDDLLGFAGIEPATALATPKHQQFAEKVHAYTFPWSGRVNTRTKDLVDLVLLIERGPLNAGQVRDALAATFSTRGTHELPAAPDPPPGRLEGRVCGDGDRGNPLAYRLPGGVSPPRTILGDERYRCDRGMSSLKSGRAPGQS